MKGAHKVGEGGSLLLLDDDSLRLPARSWQIHRIRIRYTAAPLESLKLESERGASRGRGGAAFGSRQLSLRVKELSRQVYVIYCAVVAQTGSR